MNALKVALLLFIVGLGLTELIQFIWPNGYRPVVYRRRHLRTWSTPTAHSADFMRLRFVYDLA